MKILTLTQPWATLMAIGAKAIETRSWGTKYRGPLAIHASRGPLGIDPDADAEAWNLARIATVEAGYSSMDALPRGAIVGVVELVDVWQMVGTPGGRCAWDEDPNHPPAICICGGAIHEGVEEDPPLNRRERAFGYYAPGRWAWITDPESRIRLHATMPWKGAQGLREIDPAVAARLVSGVA